MSRPGTPPALDRGALFDDRSLAGAELCLAYSDRMDRWLAALFDRATGGEPVEGLSLVAVGGYGRRELSPRSDVDVLMLHGRRVDPVPVAEELWYPIWDEGLKLGHAVRSTKEALALAGDDLDTATSVLSARHLAGDPVLTTAFAENALGLWRKLHRRWLTELAASVEVRHARYDEVAFLLEPDLKEGRGGLRDVHAIGWAEAGAAVMLPGDPGALAEAYSVLLGARVELHRVTGRNGDQLLLQEQDAVAAALGYATADDLMRSVASAARTIAWRSDEVWDRVLASLDGKRRSVDEELEPGIVLRSGTVHLADDVDLATDPLMVLRLAGAAARAGARIDRSTLQRLAGESDRTFTWSAEARSLFAALFAAGRGALPVVEALDQVGAWVRVLPEWEPVRFKPQRNAYHRFTVDRHLCEAAVNASDGVGRVDRPDLLVVGALLHDIGKGYPGDHTEVGIDVVEAVGRRMGYATGDIAVLQDLVRHHLLLPDVATRRDIGDEATIRFVAGAVGDRVFLHLLHELTVADATATGPAAWNEWKAGLVDKLVQRVDHVLGGGDVGDVSGHFPTDEQRALMAAGETVVSTDDDRLTVIAPDRPGLFSRIAGVLALDGLDVLTADAHSADGMALSVLRVSASVGGEIRWERVVEHLSRALEGRLALTSRVAERARSYRRSGPVLPGVGDVAVTVDNHTSSTATIVEVLAGDAVGTLYRITQAIAELELDIRAAKVQTLGPQVVDSFYLVDAAGDRVTDESYLVELERAILHNLHAPI
jgi:[protein-PII] uridylyltransferase